MITIVAKFTVKEGQESTFLNLIEPLIIASRAEEGNIEYGLHKNTENTSVLCMIEKWKDQAAVDTHNNSAHFTSIIPKLVELAEVTIDVYEPL